MFTLMLLMGVMMNGDLNNSPSYALADEPMIEDIEEAPADNDEPKQPPPKKDFKSQKRTNRLTSE